MAIFREHRCGCVTAEGTTCNGQTVVIQMECKTLRKRSDEYFNKIHGEIVKFDTTEQRVEFMTAAANLLERHIWEEHLRDEGTRVHWNGTSAQPLRGSRTASSSATEPSVAGTPSC